MPRRKTIRKTRSAIRKRNKILSILRKRITVKELAVIFNIPEATIYRATNKKIEK